MKNIYLLFALLTIILSCQTKKVKVNIIVNSSTLDDTSKIYIAGDNPQMGNWNASQIALNRSNNSWERTFYFPKGKSVEFKFTKGSWASEALTDDNYVMQNLSINVDNDTTFQITINKWKDTDSVAANILSGKITGNVNYIKNISYDGLLNRDIIVWLPPNYDKNKDDRYGVLYMHDGQNIIDPATSNIGFDWQVDETMDSLICNKVIAPMIVVGIYNTADRSEDYSDCPKGRKYMKLIVNKIKPMIDSLYRTKPEREFTSVGGSSMGGLISFMLAWEYDSVFSRAICMSPALKVAEYDYVKNVEEFDKKKKNIELYIDIGGVGLEQRLRPGIDDMIEALNDKGFVNNKDYYFIVDKNAAHNEKEWAKRLGNAFTLLYGVKK